MCVYAQEALMCKGKEAGWNRLIEKKICFELDIRKISNNL